MTSFGQHIGKKGAERKILEYMDFEGIIPKACMV
jgi:hypothetical protein